MVHVYSIACLLASADFLYRKLLTGQTFEVAKGLVNYFWKAWGHRYTVDIDKCPLEDQKGKFQYNEYRSIKAGLHIDPLLSSLLHEYLQAKWLDQTTSVYSIHQRTLHNHS